MEYSKEVQRHACFYMESVTFLVEDCLFKVPREPFEKESAIFCDMFALPQDDGEIVEGLSDEAPIQLFRVNKEDFEQLLNSALFSR
ncbi:hypothetical protein EDD15DRAFT_2376797 [Pisolithus albus]|nr:hypothetical protein EDD15DRAFT_2376797 [Pisolithus albus]